MQNENHLKFYLIGRELFGRQNVVFISSFQNIFHKYKLRIKLINYYKIKIGWNSVGIQR